MGALVIELALTICLLDDSRICREEHMTFANVSIFTCMIGGQAQIADYMQRRPRWYVSKWKCQPAGQIVEL